MPLVGLDSRRLLILQTNSSSRGKYLRAWSPLTVRVYRQSFETFITTYAEPLSRDSLRDFVMAMRKRRLTPWSINIRLRTVNLFLSWLPPKGTSAFRSREPASCARLAKCF